MILVAKGLRLLAKNGKPTAMPFFPQKPHGKRLAYISGSMRKISTTDCKRPYSDLKPEWVRVPEAVKISGLGRSSIYELIGAGKIKSFSKRDRGALWGIRLISYDSLVEFLENAYLASLENATPPPPSQGDEPPSKGFGDPLQIRNGSKPIWKSQKTAAAGSTLHAEACLP